MSNITFSQKVIDSTKFHVSNDKTFFCIYPFISVLLYSPLESLCESFSWSAQANCWKSKYFFYLHLLWRLNFSEKIFTVLFHRHIVDVWNWQILTDLIHHNMKLKTFVASTQPAHSPGCLNMLWRSAGLCFLSLQSWWRARRNHTIQLSE